MRVVLNKDSITAAIYFALLSFGFQYCALQETNKWISTNIVNPIPNAIIKQPFHSQDSGEPLYNMHG